MSIGLYDQDVSSYVFAPFNLEIMKLATYYKNKREIVVLSRDFAPEKYTKYFLRKDYDDGDYSYLQSREPNISYGGYAFTNGVYVPLAREIELCKPDTSIYQTMKSRFQFIADGDKTISLDIFERLFKAEHARLSLDGKTVWSEWRAQLKEPNKARLLILHDKNLVQIKGAAEELQKIIQENPNLRIGMKFPIETSDEKELLKWTALIPAKFFFSLHFTGVLSHGGFVEYLNQQKDRPFAKRVAFDYTFAPESFESNDFEKNPLREIFRQVLIARRYRVIFSLKCDEEKIVKPVWGELILLFNQFLHSSTSNPRYMDVTFWLTATTLTSYVAHWGKTPNYAQISKRDARRIFSYVREKNYPVFKDFYECNFMTLQEEGFI